MIMIFRHVGRRVALHIGLVMFAVGSARAQTVIDPLSGKPLDPQVVAAVVKAMDTAKRADPHNSANHLAQAGLMAACGADIAVSMYAAGKGVQLNNGSTTGQVVQTPLQYGLTTMAVCAGASAGLWRMHSTRPDLTRWVARALTSLATMQALRGQQLLGTD